MENLDSIYQSGPLAYVDWVAGGNYDGYVYQKQLRFCGTDDVEISTTILDQSRYDGLAVDSIGMWKWAETDHGTITITLGDIKMRGVFLGSEREYLVFSIFHPDFKQSFKECYRKVKADEG